VPCQYDSAIRRDVRAAIDPRLHANCSDWQREEKEMFTRILCVLLVISVSSTAAFSNDADAEKAKSMLKRVAIEIKKDQAAAIQMFTKGENGFRDGYIYPFCFRLSDGIVVTGQTAGRDIRTFSGIAGQQMFDAAHKTEPEVTRLEYLGPKPGVADRTPVRKVSFLRRIGELGCGVGYYP
jgi:hypothetical protein